MTTFDTRYKKLNTEQKQAVDTIDGPLIVIAGPGTGKTELLSMRAAAILKQTDTLPQNILCLTFTDSGAAAMRARLAQIIGPAAYKVAIQTFHSFGTEVINHHSEYFYRGATFQPADELSSHEILTSIFDELSHDDPLASKMNNEYTYLRDTMTAISELKQAGLTSDELLRIITANDETLDTAERDLTTIFSQKISTTMLSLLVPVAEKIAALPLPTLPPAIMPLANDLSLSMAHAFDQAVESGKTTSITAWRNAWMEKNERGEFVFKNRKRHAKLRSLAHVYFSYLTRMEQAGLYDYDDMILQVVHAMETHDELRYTLQETYQYIMVDEFQDTNLAQMRILFNLTSGPNNDAPNIMVVGDDDQAIYSFQGADVGNIHRFRQQYPAYQTVTLINNYRSAQAILDHAREVITQADGRLEQTMDISKQLIAHNTATAVITQQEFSSHHNELAWVAEHISKQIKNGVSPADIAVLARRHHELVELLPYLKHHDIAINYERRDNVLDLPVITTLELLSHTIVSIAEGEYAHTDAHLPELLAHPMYGFSAESIWRLGLTAHRNGLTWLETMMTTPEFVPLATWLIERAKASIHEPLELFLDSLIGIQNHDEITDVAPYISPYYQHYFSAEILDNEPDRYLNTLEALRTIRTALRDYRPDQTLHVTDFLDIIARHRELGATITTVRNASTHIDTAINLMTAHKSKGLEFDTVYVIGSVDSMWGERARSRSRLISYPENLPISPNADTYDERLRLYYVAMTRAKRALYLTYATTNDSGKSLLPAGFLSGTTIKQTTVETEYSTEERTEQAELSWHERLTSAPTTDMKELLAPTLERYKLSATHLNNFIDITRGGPAAFLTNNLLRFPQAKSAHAGYGTAIHSALQRAHNHLIATSERRAIEDILGDFTVALQQQHLDEQSFARFSQRGIAALTQFLSTHYDSFTRHQKTELSFANQHVTIGDAVLTGSLDLVDIEDKHITVTDYKTGKPSREWRGKTDAEKIKLHKYRQQLMFYQLLVSHSRDYSNYTFDGGVLQFVEPDQTGDIIALEDSFTADELERFAQLINAVWHCITTLDFPDVSEFQPNYKGVLAFEESIIDNYSKKS